MNLQNHVALCSLKKHLINHANLGMDAIYDEDSEAFKFHQNAMDEIHILIEKLKSER